MNAVLFALLVAFVSSTFTILPLEAASNSQCPPKFSAHEEYCYLAVVDELTQPEAVDKCHTLGGNLASIHDEKEFDFIVDLVDAADPGKEHRFWIGLVLTLRSDNAKLVNCSFNDGSAYDYGACVFADGRKPWTTSPNAGREPNNFTGRQECVSIGNNVALEYPGYVDDKCEEKLGFICKQ